ncbi:MAG TPA: Si-specific NAD(P)(+) transhydrogenase [Thermoanaerobaculia bacterium]
MYDYDLIVIGSGPAGEKGAAQAAWFGRRVALIEKLPVTGGACVNTGTVPSKTLREAALQLSGLKQREVYGLDFALQRNVGIAALTNRRIQVIERQHEQIEANLVRHRVERYHGKARFLSPHELLIENGGSGQRITADVVLIATGSSPYRPPLFPFDGVTICDSDSILELDRIPRSLAVVGAGVIGCEYASIFGALGVPVHLIDGRHELLPHLDRELVSVLLAAMSRRLNVTPHLGAGVKGVREGVELELDDDSVVNADVVLVAAGRSSNTADLGLEAAGVTTGIRGAIEVNERFQTNVANIYAAGDVIGFPALASTSMEQARVAMVHAFDLKYKTEVSPVLPYAIYTIPEIAMVGFTEEQCIEQGRNVAVGRARFEASARGQIIGDEEGLIKLVFDADTLELLGVHIVGESASELLHVGSMVMHFGGTINAFIESVFNYPTLSDGFKYAAYDGLGNIARAKTFAVLGDGATAGQA